MFPPASPGGEWQARSRFGAEPAGGGNHGGDDRGRAFKVVEIIQAEGISPRTSQLHDSQDVAALVEGDA